MDEISCPGVWPKCDNTIRSYRLFQGWAMGAINEDFQDGFQKSCIVALSELVVANGGEVLTVEKLGIAEKYGEVKFVTLDGSVATAWIYEDECMVTAPSGSYHFEKPDFRNADELQQCFLELVASLANGESPPSFKGSSWIGFFRGRKL